MMKLFAPEYYKDFKCIADKCTHSCCVGWEIGVDGDTLLRYENLPEEERKEILSHIDGGVIRLCDDGRCPFLDGCGLCRIISGYGEDFTSVICREHPRFYNFTGGRAEVGLGASCEEAARMILSSDAYDSIVEIGEREEEVTEAFDPTADRSFIYSVLKDRERPLSERMIRIRRKYSLPEELFSEESVRRRLSDLEYMREEDRETLALGSYIGTFGDSLYSERFFAYLVYRHLSGACSFENLRARLCLCIMLSMVFESILTIKLDKIVAARLISEEIEYSEDNIDSLIFDFECEL